MNYNIMVDIVWHIYSSSQVRFVWVWGCYVAKKKVEWDLVTIIKNVYN